ncbi:hypothetical protein K9M79_04105 [Candidatus Woesearchaeota archaeon]|nr:hypothetical protein [Candidatus Woesearchaeota archaeon]
MKSYCCSAMQHFAQFECDYCGDKLLCPQSIIHEDDSDYGIIVHDDTKSIIQINYCPWCGSSLRKQDIFNVSKVSKENEIQK